MKHGEHEMEREEFIVRCLEALHEKDRLCFAGRFIQGFVHNANGPLQNLSMLSEMLLAGLDLQEKIFREQAGENAQWAEIVGKQRKRLTQLRDQIFGLAAELRDFMQIYEIERSSTQIDVNALLARILAVFKSDLFFKHKVKAELRLAKNLPQIKIPGRNLIPALFHLFHNAITAMRNSPRREFTVETLAEEGCVFVRVTDTGCGLCECKEPESLFRIFESRWPQESEESKNLHLGFGLYAARELLEPHGCSITLECGEDSTSAVIRIQLPEPCA